MIVRVAEEGKPAFQLRKGEEGISTFDTERAQPPLTDDEILDGFRPGSILVVRHIDEIEANGLRIEPVDGTSSLPRRLRLAHMEIRPKPGMSRSEFKRALSELEQT